MKDLKRMMIAAGMCVMIGAVTACSGQQTGDNNKENVSQEETVAETEAQTLPVIPQPTVEIPTASVPAEKTFATDEEAYKYAVSQMDEGKYYLAVKYLRKIPNYKDSKQLQIKAVNAMKQDYLGFDQLEGKVIATGSMNQAAKTSGSVLNRKDAGLGDAAVLQRLEYSYIDASGNLKMAVDNVPKDIYDSIYAPLLQQNKSVKYKKVLISWVSLTGTDVTPLRAHILTMDNQVLEYDTNKKQMVSYGSPIEGETLIDINDKYALSDKGNVYSFEYDSASNQQILSVDNKLSDIAALSYTGTAVAQGLYELCGFVSVNTNGNVVADTAMAQMFPVLKSWSDIISIEMAVQYESYGYCAGLTSAGEVLVAYQGGVTTLKPFDANKKYVAIACFEGNIVALTDAGEMCVEVMPNWGDKQSGTIEIPEYTSTASKTSTDKTFAGDSEIYNYAKTCFDEGKYIEAIKYLRKIPDYKDTSSLMDKVYRLANHDFIAVNNIRYTEQDKMFSYSNKDIINNTNMQELSCGYIDSQGVFNFTNIEYRNYDVYKKAMSEYNAKVKFKQISHTGEHGWNEFNLSYILTQEGKLVRINAVDRVGITGFDDVDMSALSAGEQIVYISGNAALSNKGYVYYIKNLKLEKDNTLSDIAIIKSGCGVLLAVNVDGKIAYSQPEGWKIPMTLSVLENVVSVDMCLQNSTDSGFFAALKADGSVVIVRRAGSEIVTELPKDKKFVAISFNYMVSECRLIAVTAEGEIYVVKMD